MNAPSVISTFFLLILASCNNPSVEDKPQQEIPKALEDKSFSYEAISKRDYDDLLESLYKELAEKTPELKDLDNSIEKIYQSNVDSIKLFDNYSSKNEAFYSSANNHATQIKDSLLRQRVKLLIANSLTKYKSSITQHEEILNSIKTKNM